MKEQLKVGEKWVYIKCLECGKKKDFAIDKLKARLGNVSIEEYAETFKCKTCLSTKQKPIVKKQIIESIAEENSTIPEKKDYKPYTKEKQLGRKEKKILPSQAFDEDFFAK